MEHAGGMRKRLTVFNEGNTGNNHNRSLSKQRGGDGEPMSQGDGEDLGDQGGADGAGDRGGDLDPDGRGGAGATED